MTVAARRRGELVRRVAIRTVLGVAACASPLLAQTPPTNDACAGAAVIPPSGPFPYLTGTYNIGAAGTAGDPPAPACQTDVSRSIWLRFTPAVSTGYSFSLCPEAGTATTVEDTVLAIYTSAGGACGGPYSPLPGACDDDSCDLAGLQSVLAEVPLEAGTTYFVVAWQYSATPPPTCQPNGTHSVWYRFTPATSSGYEISTCASAPTGTTVNDTVVSVYTSSNGGCSGSFTQVAGGATTSPARPRRSRG